MNFRGKNHLLTSQLVDLRSYNLSGSLVSSWVGKPDFDVTEADGVWRDDLDGFCYDLDMKPTILKKKNTPTKPNKSP